VLRIWGRISTKRGRRGRIDSLRRREPARARAAWRALVALTSGGAIPDNADYLSCLSERDILGTVNIEDAFASKSMLPMFPVQEVSLAQARHDNPRCPGSRPGSQRDQPRATPPAHALVHGVVMINARGGRASC